MGGRTPLTGAFRGNMPVLFKEHRKRTFGIDAVEEIGREEFIDHDKEDICRCFAVAVRVKHDLEAPVICKVLRIVNHLPERRQGGEFFRVSGPQPVDKSREFCPVAFLLLVHPPAHVLVGGKIFRKLVGAESQNPKRIIDMRKGVHEIEIQYRVEFPHIPEGDRLTVQVFEYVEIFAVVNHKIHRVFIH